MGSRENLLSEFYASVDRTKVKIELRENSFDNLQISNSDYQLDYGEFKNGVLKYKLNGVSPECFEYLIKQHVHEKISLCAYFDSRQSSLFALNLDSAKKGTNEVKVAALLFIKELEKLKMTPLVLKSGHGYHFWCRLSSAVQNETLQRFTSALKDIILAEMVKNGASPENVNCTIYPRLRADDISLRLFGGMHSRTGEFSSIVTAINFDDTILSIDESWAIFEWYLSNCVVSSGDFEKALEFILQSKYLNPGYYQIEND